MNDDALHRNTHGACFGTKMGWERVNWFAPAGIKPVVEYGWGRQNWFAHSAAEHLAARSEVALFDQTSFAKIAVRGPDAEAALQYLCAGDVAVPPGRTVYTPLLNDRGGYEADVTVTRLRWNEYLLVTIAVMSTSAGLRSAPPASPTSASSAGSCTCRTRWRWPRSSG